MWDPFSVYVRYDSASNVGVSMFCAFFNEAFLTVSAVELLKFCVLRSLVPPWFQVLEYSYCMLYSSTPGRAGLGQNIRKSRLQNLGKFNYVFTNVRSGTEVPRGPPSWPGK